MSEQREFSLMQQRLLHQLCDVALEAISPTRCAGCERPGTLICDACLKRMVPIDPAHACIRCGAPYGDLLCTECAEDRPTVADTGTGVSPEEAGRCLAAVVFQDPVPRIIRAYKDAGERRLAQPIAELMLDAAQHAECVAGERYGGMLSNVDTVTFVPVTAAAFARRGFDHMELIARAFAKMAGVLLVDTLVKHGKSDQRVLGRAERRAQAQGMYEVVAPVEGRRLLLLDDVITTGATMRAVRRALIDAGACSVDVLAFARVW